MLQPQKIDELLKLLNYQNVRTIINPFWRTYTCRCTPIDFTHLWLTCSSHSTGSFPRSAKAWSPGESAIELRSKAKMMPKCGHELTNKMGKWASAAFKTTEELLFFEIQNSFKADIRLHQCIRSSVHKKKDACVQSWGTMKSNLPRSHGVHLRARKIVCVPQLLS